MITQQILKDKMLVRAKNGSGKISNFYLSYEEWRELASFKWSNKSELEPGKEKEHGRG